MFLYVTDSQTNQPMFLYVTCMSKDCARLVTTSAARAVTGFLYFALLIILFLSVVSRLIEDRTAFLLFLWNPFYSIFIRFCLVVC